jgi:hypothetical protein
MREMNVNDISKLFPHFSVDTFEHVLGHVSKAAGKLHGLVGDADHIEAREEPGSDDARSAVLREEAFAAAEHDNGKAARAYIADLVICAARLAVICPSGAFDLQQAIEDRMAEKKDYLKQYAART